MTEENEIDILMGLVAGMNKALYAIAFTTNHLLDHAAKEGIELSAGEAMKISKDPEYLREMAIAAINITNKTLNILKNGKENAST